MASVIVAAIILIIIGLAMAYIIKEKKKGIVCIGCPHAGTCASKNKAGNEHNCSDGQNGSAGCGCH